MKSNDANRIEGNNPDKSTILVRGSVTRTLFAMAFPMLAGTFSMNAYNLTDTWFVAQLGTRPLAAMGFSFPVVMLLTFIAGGIGTGITTLVSHAIGRHDNRDASTLTTHGIMLTTVVTVVISVAGYLLIRPVFLKLGASEDMLPLIGDYMRTWYFGAIFMTLPMLGSGVLISTGDSKAASRFIILGTVLNIILDPIMIFGYLGCPAMGIRGAALATVIARAVSALFLVYLLWKKHHLLTWASWKAADYADSLRRITGFAVPSILSMVLMPISSTVITKILSTFGNEAVAAGGAATRIEMFAFVIPMALGISLTPFVSQNFGAGRQDRLREAQKLSTLFAIGYGIFIALILFAGAPWLASIFSEDPKVLHILVQYIRIISFGYGMMEVHRYCGFFLTGMHKPSSTTVLNVIRVLVLLIPFSYLGAHYWGIVGLFSARLATDILAGSIGLIWVLKVLAAADPIPRSTDGMQELACDECEQN